jgi:NADH-quinone oxidoreductase subunit C
MDEPNLDSNTVVRKLRERLPQACAELIEFRGETTVVMPREMLVSAANFLKSDPELSFTFLSDITVVDRFPMEPRFEMNYQLLSMARRERIGLRVRVPGADPVMPSVTQVWEGANWHEREIFDLFGVRFSGHPDLRRILMPDDWEGHPLRKDYPVEGYR